MNGEVIQQVALTCHANALLRGIKTGEFFPGNSTCKFCERIRFVRLEPKSSGGTQEVDVAPKPEEWLAYLQSGGAQGVSLFRTPRNEKGVPDRKLAAFVGGGGTWVMQAFYPGDRVDYWVARWEVGDRNAADRRIWKVTYGLVSRGKGSKDSFRPVLSDRRKELKEALEDIRSFSQTQSYDLFTALFNSALDRLKSVSRDTLKYCQDLAPSGVLTEEAQGLLQASQDAWVFGGMGSWNDMGFEDEKTNQEYERVSERLFQTLTKTIIASANAFLFPSPIT